VKNVSVTEALKLKRQWTASKEFVSFVAQLNKKSVRAAYTDIKKAVINKDILKVILQDQNRTVIYGLPEFGKPDTWVASGPQTLEPLPESEEDKMKAAMLLKNICQLRGRRLTIEEANYFLQDDGKPKLDKAKALELKLVYEMLG
jgi:uncharacterized membrane-anchored protein